MHKHEYWDMWLHDDAELGELLGSPVRAREVLQQWPLSQVERVETADGPVIYKCQCGPTVEPEFYAAARSPLLPEARTIYRGRGCSCMLIEFLDSPRLEDIAPDAAEVLRVGRELLESIAAIRGRLPCRLDISTPHKWRDYSGQVLRQLDELIHEGRFTETEHHDWARLRRWAESDAPLRALQRRRGCVHGDLSPDNIFVTDEGLRVIDWQFPMLGPPELDLVVLLDGSGVDPRGHLAPELVRLREFLGVGWMVECQTRWIPTVTSYDSQVAELARRDAGADGDA